MMCPMHRRSIYLCHISELCMIVYSISPSLRAIYTSNFEARFRSAFWALLNCIPRPNRSSMRFQGSIWAACKRAKTQGKIALGNRTCKWCSVGHFSEFSKNVYLSDQLSLKMDKPTSSKSFGKHFHFLDFKFVFEILLICVTLPGPGGAAIKLFTPVSYDFS
jgi:hypothetical protein